LDVEDDTARSLVVAREERRFQELRAEWQALKGTLIDSITGLPSFPAVLEDLRGRIEAGERLGLIYLDLSSEARLESIYGWETYDNLLQQVAQIVEAFCRDELPRQAVAAVNGVHGDEFLVFSSADRREDAARTLAGVRTRLLQRLTSRLQLQFDNESPRPITLHSAVVVLELDPMIRIERSVYRCLEAARARCRLRREEQHHRRLAELHRIVAAEDIDVRFQPVVRLRDGVVHGFEALTCGPPGSIFESPEMLFAFAEETDEIHELERICRMKSVSRARGLENGTKLFLNCSARGLAQPETFCRNLVDQAERCGLRPQDIVLEITERVAITAWQDFRRSVAALRLIGFPIAIDDVGAGYSSLQSVAETEPEYLKVDLSLVRDLHRSSIKQGLLKSLVGLAGSIGSRMIAEGVEEEGELEALKGLGVGYAQGFFFSRPESWHTRFQAG
jgi:EAL domain-containing protein (putative c-di-GMP-specific phosphodiesterase class I)/GGDEF domain-containing protein